MTHHQNDNPDVRRALHNGEQWFVNDQRVLWVSDPPGGPRVIHYTDGNKRDLIPTVDVVRMEIAAVTPAGQQPALPQFGAGGIPTNAVPRAQRGRGVGFTSRGGRTARSPPTVPLGQFVHAGTMASDTTLTMFQPYALRDGSTPAPVKHLSFADAAQPGAEDVIVPPADTDLNMANAEVNRFHLAMQADVDRADGEGGDELPSERMLIAEVPDEMTADLAVEWLLTKDFSSLSKDEVALLLWHAAGYWPTDAERDDFYTFWSDRAYAGLGNISKLSQESAALYREALAYLQHNTAADRVKDADGRDDGAALHHGDQMATTDMRTDAVMTEAQPEFVMTEAQPELVSPPAPAVRGVQIPPPSGLTAAPHKRVHVSLSEFDDSVFPECFKDFSSPTPGDVELLQDRWRKAWQTVVKQKKPDRGQKIHDVPQYMDGLAAEAIAALTGAGIAPKLRDCLDPLDEMVALLMMELLEPSLRARVSKHVTGIPTQGAVRRAVDLEVSAQRDITEYYNDVTYTRIKHNYTGGLGKWADFFKDFQAAWQRYAGKVGFVDAATEDVTKVFFFHTTLPWSMQQKVQRQTMKEFPGRALPPTWADMLRIAKEADTKIHENKTDAKLAQSSASGSRGRGSKPVRGGRGGHNNNKGRSSSSYLKTNKSDTKRTQDKGDEGSNRGRGRGGFRGRGRGRGRGRFGSDRSGDRSGDKNDSA